MLRVVATPVGHLWNVHSLLILLLDPIKALVVFCRMLREGNTQCRRFRRCITVGSESELQRIRVACVRAIGALVVFDASILRVK